MAGHPKLLIVIGPSKGKLPFQSAKHAPKESDEPLTPSKAAVKKAAKPKPTKKGKGY